MAENDDFEISIFIPEDSSFSSPRRADPTSKEHVSFPIFQGGVTKVSARVMTQWEQTLTRLVQMGSKITSASEEWRAEEIEIGFTLSAEGELSFIAKAGAQASVTVKLKRKTS